MIRALPLVAVLVLSACSSNSPAPEATESPAPASEQPTATALAANPFATDAAPFASQAPTGQAAVQPVPAELPETVARVNGQAISRTELEDAVDDLEARAGQPVPADQRDQVYRGVLDQLVGYRLLLQESATRAVAVTDTELDARIGEIRQQFPSEEAFAQQLAQRGMTQERLRAELRDSLRIDRMLEAEMASQPGVSAQDVATFYQQNTSEFQQGERVRASHILIPVPQNADAAAREAARTQATSVLADVKAGQDFATLARQHSQDGSAAEGGDLGYFERGQMVPPFAEAAFALQPSQTSGLVETDFGFHIIKVVDRQPARTVPLEEVRPQIEQFLTGQLRQQQVGAFVESLKAKGRVDIFI